MSLLLVPLVLASACAVRVPALRLAACDLPGVDCSLDPSAGHLRVDYWVNRDQSGLWLTLGSERPHLVDPLLPGHGEVGAGVPARMLVELEPGGERVRIGIDLGRDGRFDRVYRGAIDFEGELTGLEIDDVGPERTRTVAFERVPGRGFTLVRRDDGAVLLRATEELRGDTHIVHVYAGAAGHELARIDTDRGDGAARQRRVLTLRRGPGRFERVRWTWDEDGGLTASDWMPAGAQSWRPRCRLEPTCTLGFDLCEAVCEGRAREQRTGGTLRLRVRLDGQAIAGAASPARGPSPPGPSPRGAPASAAEATAPPPGATNDAGSEGGEAPAAPSQIQTAPAAAAPGTSLDSSAAPASGVRTPADGAQP